MCAATGSAVTNETRYLSADDPLGQPVVVLPRVQDVEYGEGQLQICAYTHTKQHQCNPHTGTILL